MQKSQKLAGTPQTDSDIKTLVRWWLSEIGNPNIIMKQTSSYAIQINDSNELKLLMTSFTSLDWSYSNILQ